MTAFQKFFTSTLSLPVCGFHDDQVGGRQFQPIAYFFKRLPFDTDRTARQQAVDRLARQSEPLGQPGNVFVLTDQFWQAKFDFSFHTWIYTPAA